MKILLYAFLFCIFYGSGAYAQDSTQSYMAAKPHFLIERQYNNKRVYKKLAIQARNYDKRNEFPFSQLVYAYAAGPDYDPYGKDTIDMLYKLAYEIENQEDPDILEKKFLQFNTIVNNHLGNLGIVNAVISLTRQNKTLCDIKFLEWIKGGLIERLLRSGDGYNIATAYQIVSMEEETLLLLKRNLELIGREYFSTGTQFYHIYRTIGRKTGDPVKLYTNLGLVMSHEIVSRYIENPYYKFTPQIPDDY